VMYRLRWYRKAFLS